METTALAASLAGFLGPLIPYLVQGGERAAEVLGQQSGQAGWRKTAAIWDKLRVTLVLDASVISNWICDGQRINLSKACYGFQTGTRLGLNLGVGRQRPRTSVGSFGNPHRRRAIS